MKKTKILAVLLCIVMLLTAFSGCGGAAEPSEAPAEVASASAEAPAEEAPAEAPTEEASDFTLPICEEKTTISYWFEMSPMVAGYLDTMNDNITYQHIEELTNVHVDFWAVSDETAQNFNLMVASGDYADIMVWGSRYYAGGAIKAVEDEVFMELTDVIDQYMPNYGEKIADKDIYPQIVMSDGRIGEVFPINWGISVPGSGPIVRKDWLDDLGIDPTTINTYDEYYDMLTRFKNEKGATQALYLGPNGVPSGNYLVAGYGIAGYCDPTSDSGPWYQDNGQVKFGLTQPEFKDYLTMMNKWFNEGLISSDYVSHSDMQVGAGDVSDGSTGLWYHMSQIMSEHVAQSADPNFDSVAIADAVLTEDGKTHLGNYSDSRVGGQSLSISATCKNTEVVAKWVDFAFSEQGSMIYSYGVENETYTVDENGKATFTELITNNEELGMITACNLYAIQVGVGYLDQDRFLPGYSPAALEAGDIWLQSMDLDNLMIMPSAATLSSEDSQLYSAAYSNIATYAAENIAKFITGTRPLDEFDAFVADIEAMDLATCQQCWQNALDVYLAQ